MRLLLIFLVLSTAVFGQDGQVVSGSSKDVFKLKSVFDSGREPILSFSLIENGRLLLVVSATTIRVWNPETNELVSEISHDASKSDAQSSRFELTSDGRSLLVSGNFHSLNQPEFLNGAKVAALVYELRSGKLLKVLGGPSKEVEMAVWNPNGDTLFILSKGSQIGGDTSKGIERHLCFLDGRTFEYRDCVTTFDSIVPIGFSRDGTKFLTLNIGKREISGDLDFFTPVVKIWTTEKPVSPTSIRLRRRSFLSDLIFFSPDGRSLIIGNDVIDLSENSVKTFEPYEQNRFFTTNGEHFFVREKDDLVLYDFKDFRSVLRIPKLKWDNDIRYFSTQRVLISQNLGRRCGRTEGFEFATGKKLWELKLACYYQPADCFFCSSKLNFNEAIVFLSDDNYFLTSSEKAIRVWETMTGNLVQVLVNPRDVPAKAKGDDRLQGEKLVWTADKRSLFFRDASEKRIFHFEFSPPR